MSFRIEDILKKGPTNSEVGLEENNNTNSEVLDLGSSILEQTLMNRLTPRHSSISLAQNFSYFQKKTTDDGRMEGCYYSQYGHREYSELPTIQSPWLPFNSSIYPVHYTCYSKRKGGQIRFSTKQTDALEKRFCLNRYLSPEERKILAESLKLSDRQVKTWFQNRRAKLRRSKSSPETSREPNSKFSL